MSRESDNGKRKASIFTIALKFLALVGLILLSGGVLALLNVIGIDGVIPILLGVAPVVYLFALVAQSKGGKEAGFILAGLFVPFIVVAILVES